MSSDLEEMEARAAGGGHSRTPHEVATHERVDELVAREQSAGDA